MTSASHEYFQRLYDRSADPWRLATSDYERGKLECLLGALPRAHYARAFEPGCAIGVTTAALASRCSEVVAMDGATVAIEEARLRTKVFGDKVSVRRGWIPQDWPTSSSFDLIVLSEVLYYLDAGARLRVADLVRETLAPTGQLALVHWRHPFPEATTLGDLAHRELTRRLAPSGLYTLVEQVNRDYRLQVLGAEPVAAQGSVGARQQADDRPLGPTGGRRQGSSVRRTTCCAQPESCRPSSKTSRSTSTSTPRSSLQTSMLTRRVGRHNEPSAGYSSRASDP